MAEGYMEMTDEFDGKVAAHLFYWYFYWTQKCHLIGGLFCVSFAHHLLNLKPQELNHMFFP